MKYLLPLVVLVLASVLPVTPQEVFVYQVTLTHQNYVEIYNYTFIINAVNNEFVNFTLIVTSLNNGSVIYNATYVFPLNNLKLLPINGSVFNGKNFTFIGYVNLKGQNASEYKGYFNVYGIYIPATAYFVNGTLYYLNGSYNGYSVTVSLYSKYNLVSSSSNIGGYIVIGVLILLIIIGVVVLIKIGKF